MQPKVSIIIPIYNVEKKLLCKCLDSLLNQTLQEIELVCVLDCPTDGSDKVVEEYAQKDSRIKIIRNEQNLHIGESRNRGIDTATGEFIGFFDDDDYCEPTMYEQLYLAAKSKKSCVAFCERNAIDLETGVIQNYKDIQNRSIEHCIEQLLKNNNENSALLVWDYIYNRDFLIVNGIRFVDTKNMSAEDVIFNTEVMFALKDTQQTEIGYVETTLYHHIGHDSNTGRTTSYMYKLPQFREHISEMVGERNNPSYEKVANTGNIAILYRVFRLHLKKEGLMSALRFIREMKNNPYMRALQSKYFKLWDRSLTPPKNMLNWLFRTMG